MEKIDIVLQGAIDAYGAHIASYYAELDFVRSVCISTWDYCPQFEFEDSKIWTVSSPDIPNAGSWNRNRQIHSSLVGLRNCEAETCVKMRLDQKVSHEGMKRMYEYYDGENIHVAGIFKPYPFHPRDHWFWGPRDKLIQLFDIPHDNSGLNDKDFSLITRPETYIGMWYAAYHDDRVVKMIENQQKYLVDGAPKLQEALDISDELTPKIFRPFPKVDFDWPKHYSNGYPYNRQSAEYGEYWGEN